MMHWVDTLLRNISSGRTNAMYIVVGLASTVVVGVVSYRYFLARRTHSKAITAAASESQEKGGSPSTALNKTSYEEYELIDKIRITHNTQLFRFKIGENQVAGVPVGQHVSLQVATAKSKASRHYTPVSPIDKKGSFDLVIKLYEDGKVTPIIHGLEIGDKARIRGPSGSFKYSPNTHKNIGMLAAGTGITPMWKIIQAVVQDTQDKAELKLLFANRTEDDVLFQKDLDTFAQDPRVSINYLFSQPKNPDAASLQGRISEDLVKAHMPPPSDDTLILVCGPRGFVKSAIDYLKELGYDRKMYHKF